MRYRPHTALLAESMEGCREFDGRAQMVQHVLDTSRWLHPDAKTTDVSFKRYGGPDDRIGWAETHAVLVCGDLCGFADRVE